MGEDDRLQAHVRSNAVKSALLIAGFPFVLPVASFVLIFVLAALFGQRDPGSVAGTAFVAVLSVVGIVTIIWLPIGYAVSQTIIDAMTGAQLVDRTQERRLWTIFENLCRKSGMRLPALRIIETDVLNAFASGLREGQYSVTVTRGLLDALDDAELEGVLAHELAHIRNHDCRLLVVATILVGLVPMIHNGAVRVFWALVMGFLNIYRAIFSVIPFPFVQVLVTASYTLMFWAGKGMAYVIGAVGNFCSLLIHFALSRRREFMADAGAVEMTGNPDAMISALRKVSGNSAIEVKVDGLREMMFDNQLVSLFATHPPIEHRIEAIRAYAESVKRRQSEPPATVVAPPATRSDPSPLAETIDRSRQPRNALGLAPNGGGEINRGVNDPAPEDVHVSRYYEALMRAMGGRPDSVESGRRHAIYRRAREALIDQVCKIEPPPAEDEAQRWQDGLETAIAMVEGQADNTLNRRARR